jgi:hypothetical protein
MISGKWEDRLELVLPIIPVLCWYATIGYCIWTLFHATFKFRVDGIVHTFQLGGG